MLRVTVFLTWLGLSIWVECGDIVQFGLTVNLDVKRGDLSLKADLATCRDIIDQINGIWATTIEEDVEISIIHHSTDIEQLLRNRMLYLS